VRFDEGACRAGADRADRRWTEAGARHRAAQTARRARSYVRAYPGGALGESQGVVVRSASAFWRRRVDLSPLPEGNR
jgi:hypothetical protein